MEEDKGAKEGEGAKEGKPGGGGPGPLGGGWGKRGATLGGVAQGPMVSSQNPGVRSVPRPSVASEIWQVSSLLGG
jgi:hypothetical protein